MKQCPKCLLVTTNEKDTCPRCNSDLNEPSKFSPTGDWAITKRDPSSYKSKEAPREKWPYILAVLIPLIGTILGFIYIGQKREDGPKVLGTSLAAWFFWAVMLYIFVFNP